MAKKIFILLSGTILNIFTASGQTEKIDTDRPDQTESVFTVPKGYFQAEFGFNKENIYGKNYDLTHPVALLKYGLNKFEFRLETVYHSSYKQFIPDPKWTTGIDPIEIGFKAALFQGKNFLPKTSVIVHFGIPDLASQQFRTTNIAPSFILTMQNSLSKKIILGYNLGAKWDGITSTPAWLYTLTTGFDIGEKWYAYIETFGFIQKNAMPQNNIDCGIAYYLSYNTKLDLSGGIGISSSAPNNYVAIGYSFRIYTKK